MWGQYNVIDKDVRIGLNTFLRSFIEIRKGTIIGENCYIDSYAKFSGDCIIGDGVTIRYNATIARGCEIGSGSYIAPNVMFNNLDTKGNKVGGAKVGQNCFIGTGSVIQHGITICDNVIIGALTFVRQSITRPGTYISGEKPGTIKRIK